MKNFLAKKWLGPLFLVLYAVGLSLFLVHKITPYIQEAAPVITQEAGNFLPITFQNGEIVQPENAYIHKSYTEGNETFHVILDTRTDTLDLSTLPNDGIYLSKKCLYIVSPDESKVRCFDSATQSPDPIVLDEEMIKNFMDKVEKYAGGFLIVFMSIFSFIGFYIVILFYTVIMHWIVALLFKTTFGQTLFVNTLTYIVCSLLEATTPFSIGFLMKIVLFVCVNWIVCKSANEKKGNA